jgi:hypothetical protein
MLAGIARKVIVISGQIAKYEICYWDSFSPGNPQKLRRLVVGLGGSHIPFLDA